MIDERVEPTVTSTGLTEGSHCSVCNEIIVAQEIIPVLSITGDEPTIYVADVNTSKAKTVTVDVMLKNNPGFLNMGIEIGYDTNIMTLTGVEANSDVGGVYMSSQELSSYPYNMSWSNADEIIFNGKLATLTFKIADDVPDGTYPITVDFYKGPQGEFTDGVDVNVNSSGAIGFVYESGNTIITNYTPGDVDGNGTINYTDAIIMLQYISGWKLENVVIPALDTDGNKSVNYNDAINLLRYISGWDVELK